MHSEDQRIGEIINRNLQYKVPVYQRHYEWDRQRWDRLWLDMHATLDRRKNQQPRYKHFFGSLVVEAGRYDQVARFSLIDGQQRLTTLQLLLKALLDEGQDNHGAVFGENERVATRLSRVIFNPENETNLQRRTRVYPSERDLEAFFGIMGIEGYDFPAQGLLWRAYNHFRSLCGGWLSGLEEGSMAARVEEFLDNILDGFQVTRTELDDFDECYSIFESLNSVAMPLRESDKIRNYCFKCLSRLEDDEQSAFYREHWLPMENAATPQTNPEKMSEHLDHLITYWAIMKTGRQFGVDSLYKEMIELTESSLADLEDRDDDAACARVQGQLFEDLCSYGSAFRAIQWPEAGLDRQRETAVIEKIGALTSPLGLRSSAHPLLLALLARYMGGGRTEIGGLLRCLEAIEAYLVRRIVCDVATNQHNRIFAGLGHQVYINQETNLGGLAEILRGELSQHQNTDDRWPDDAEFESAFLNRDFFRRGAKSRFIRALLTAVERRRPGNVLAMQDAYTVEHIMPETLEHNWRDYLGEHAEEIHRMKRNCLGNLTLLESIGNAGVGQGLLHEKQLVYEDSTVLMTRELCNRDAWRAADIDARGRELYESARLIWPGPAR